MKYSKKGAFQLSFGMIFSVIIMIATIGLAIYIINAFLGVGRCIDTGMFKEKLQENVNDAWASDKYSDVFPSEGSPLFLPEKIEAICFVDVLKDEKGLDKDYYVEFERYLDSDSNIFLYPLEETCEGQASYFIENIDISEITKENNPYCIGKSDDGKIRMEIEKGYYDNLVKISGAD